MEDKDIINKIIEIIKTDGEDLSDGECIDEIVRTIIQAGYKIDWGFR